MKNKLKRYIIAHDNFLTKLLSFLFTMFGRNTIKRGRGNKIYIYVNYLKKTRIIINGTGNTIQFGKNNHLVGCVIIINGNNNTVKLGDNNSVINCEFWIEDDGGSIMLGNSNKILGRTHLAETEGKRIILGDNCLFSTNVIFRTGDSHSILDAKTGERINPAKSIIIGDRVWFGNNTTVLKGAIIANDSIVATGAIVTKHFSDSNLILAGNPAEVVKKGIKWVAERI
ncbi:hypothetical protein [uncultured Bacteroides sp.]|uniref:acyltransferase n=1 Tax=uncultured Bacteroides sp. TaxID=162156 RepID=UPI002675C29D|nr:hypothetical protein [uncultured Bacteroides sp.]